MERARSRNSGSKRNGMGAGTQRLPGTIKERRRKDVKQMMEKLRTLGSVDPVGRSEGCSSINEPRSR